MDREIDVEHLASLKSHLEKRLKNLEEKVVLYREYIRAVDSVLTQTSFKVAADLLKENEAKGEEKEAGHLPTKEKAKFRKIELTSRVDGTRLGEMNITGASITITPADNMRIPVDSGTFNSFFLKKILNNMIEKDDGLIRSGEISGSDKMSYQASKNSDGTLKQIVISNYRDDGRLQQITTTIRWTLEKISQKAI